MTEPHDTGAAPAGHGPAESAGPTEHRPAQSDVGRLAHHFENLARQEHALQLGMWLFVASEVLLFSGLFALYSAYRARYGEEFHAALHHNDRIIGTINTAVLLVSSFTVVSALHALRNGRARLSVLFLGATIGLGMAFLVFKGVEYSEHFRDGIYPGAHYAFAELPQRGALLFFTLYFLMTGLHAIHMIAGVGVMSWLAVRVLRRKTTPSYCVELEMGGLYWHLVDCIWIFLWPLFYLVG